MAHLATTLEIYPVKYPTKFLQEGEIAEEDTKFGFTNDRSIAKHFDDLTTRKSDLPGWDVGVMTNIADKKTVEECKAEDGDLIEPVGWWADQKKGSWVTSGLMAAVELAKLYRIPYEMNSITKTFSKAGYTKTHGIIGRVRDIWGAELWANRNVIIIIVKNQKELKKLQEEDGGETRPFGSHEYEGKGWITDGLRLACDEHVKGEVERMRQNAALLVPRYGWSPGFLQPRFGP